MKKYSIAKKSTLVSLFSFAAILSMGLPSIAQTVSTDIAQTVSADTAKNISSDTAKFATLYIYRIRDFRTAMGVYEIHVADSAVCKSRNNSKYIIKLYKEGPAEIWAKTEIKSSVKINVQFGQDYYVKSVIKEGILGGRPELDLVYPEQGKLDFENVQGKKR